MNWWLGHVWPVTESWWLCGFFTQQPLPNTSIYKYTYTRFWSWTEKRQVASRLIRDGKRTVVPREIEWRRELIRRGQFCLMLPLLLPLAGSRAGKLVNARARRGANVRIEPRLNKKRGWERWDQGGGDVGGGSSTATGVAVAAWLLISRASLVPRLAAESARRLQVTPKGSQCPRLTQFYPTNVLAHRWQTKTGRTPERNFEIYNHRIKKKLFFFIQINQQFTLSHYTWLQQA